MVGLRMTQPCFHSDLLIKGWHRKVKTRLFLANLRDHYEDLAKLQSFIDPNNTTSTVIDSWAFDYISTAYMRPLSEAFDEDGSGAITIYEVNEFVRALPTTIKWRYSSLSS